MAATVSGLQGLMKEAVLALEKVQPKAACKTCCLEGMMEMPKVVRKSMPSKGVAAVANKKSNSNCCPEKQTENRRNPQAGIVLPLAFTRCGPVGGYVEACGKMDNDAPESTKKWKLFCVSFRKI